MTNRNNRSAKLVLFLLALAVLAGYQPGLAETQDIGQLRKEAEQGHAEAQYNLGFMYHTGKGVPEDDQEAAKWFRKAAEQGDARAQFNLRNMYVHGEGVPEDDREAEKWFRRAAEQGVAPAQFNLGLMYADAGGGLAGWKPEGVPAQDLPEALKWLRLAAEQGHDGAQFNLGRMYYEDKGVPEDYVKAYAWINLAASQGEEIAVEAKDRLRPRITAEQVAEAQELAAELFKRIESSKPE